MAERKQMLPPPPTWQLKVKAKALFNAKCQKEDDWVDAGGGVSLCAHFRLFNSRRRRR